MIILDTSFLFAYFRENDVHHAAARKLAKKYSGDQLVVTFLVFQELISVLNRKASTLVAVEVAKQLMDKENNINILRLDENYMEDIVNLYKKLGVHSFSYIDVSLIHLSKELGLPVLTFDRLLEEKLKSV